MIHKIVKLTSIGKYQGYVASGDVAFKKLTLIYSENGCGKTTLTSVFRSANENEPLLLTRRKTLTQAAPQAAQIVHRDALGDTYHTFNHASGWNAPLSAIEIFDSHFVNKNVYSGFEFNDDHKKQLHEFVIGAQGVSLKRQIEQNKLDKAACRQRISSIEQQIIQTVGNGLTDSLLVAFVRLAPGAASGIDPKIADAEAALASANAQTVINSLPALSRIDALNFMFDYGQAKADLLLTSDGLQTEALRSLFLQHCEGLLEHGLMEPELWLRQGYNYINVKRASQESVSNDLPCPFCRQNLQDNSNIILAYAGKFNDAFNQLITRLENHDVILQRLNVDAIIEKIRQTRSVNDDKINTWMTHLQTPPPSHVIFADENLLRTKYQDFLQDLQSKKRFPAVLVSDGSCIEFETQMIAISSAISLYNGQIDAYNQAITTFKTGIGSATQAQAKVSELKRVKKRFELSTANLCSQLTTEKLALTALDRAYSTLIQQQEISASAFFTTYQTKVNYYLSIVFKTGFQIDSVATVSPQGRSIASKLAYRLTLDSHPIGFDNTFDNSVHECLSEGDKSTIALAFFLAKLELEPNLANTIIIFDDPLSSFDSNRRGYTVEILSALFARVKQIIVLSHDEYFLHDIDKRFGPADARSLRIFENFSTKASFIEPLNIDILVENKYFKHMRELNDFISTPDLAKKDIVLSWIRTVLEAYIGFRFVRQLCNIPSHQRALGNFILALVNGNVPFRDNANRAFIISKLNTLNGISMSLHHGNNSPGNITPIDTSTMTVTELVNYIGDAFTLIEHDL